MVAKKTAKPRSRAVEEPEAYSPAGGVTLAVLLYGLAVLLGYLTLAVPNEGTAMVRIQGVLFGLGGSMAILIPIFVAWLATLTALKAAGRRQHPVQAVGDGLMFLLLFTSVHLFSTEDILLNRIGEIRAFGNFVAQSWRYLGGGGAIGSLLAWPLYNALGVWGGLMALIAAGALVLTINGRIPQAVRALRGSAERSRERMMEREPDPHVRRERRVRPEESPRAVEREERMEPRPRRPRPQSADPARAGDVKRRRSEPASLQEMPPLPGEEVWGPMAAEPPVTVGRSRRPKVDVPPELREEESRKQRPSPVKRRKAEAEVDFPEDLFEAAPIEINLDKEIITKKERDAKAEPLPEEPPAPMERHIEEKAALPKLKRSRRREAEEADAYNYPPIDLLTPGDRVQANHRESDMQKAALLEETLKQFGISTTLCGIAHGPAVTRFELQPEPGVRVNRITSLSDDIAMHLAAMSVRIEAPIPGKAAVGVEIPNDHVEMVRLRDVLESQEARKNASRIAVGLGKDNSGRYIVADIAKMPHVLIAGQTGSGKSVCINSIITSILYRATPDEVKLILIDPKVVELSIYNDIPHLVCPVVTDCKKAASALEWAVAEMTKRYKQFAEKGVRDIKGFNKALEEGEKPMPQMVIIIDELADLMMVAPGEVEDSICRLAQLARAAGMHLVIATQRPSVNVITGIIKANIPSRIAFSVASQVDSRTMIDHGGAEKLLGNGDMLFVPPGTNKPTRVQGAWVSDEEVHAIVDYIKERSETTYDEDMIEQMNNAVLSDAEREEVSSEYDPRLPEAVEIVVEAGQASTSMLQRRMRVGYARAGRLIDEMEQRGIIDQADGSKPRNVLITREQMNEMFEDGDEE